MKIFKTSPLGSILSTIGSLFFSGLFAILPLTITLILLNVFFRFIISWLEPVHRLVQPTFLGTIPYVEVFLIIACIFLVGIIYRLLILRSIIHAIDALFIKIPLVRPIYSGVRQLVRAFSAKDEVTFKKVVLVEFPRKGIFSIGFLTSKFPSHLAPQKEKTFFNVYIPTTPNPTTGYFVVIPEEELTVVDLTRQEAMALIMSGGIIKPERFSK